MAIVDCCFLPFFIFTGDIMREIHSDEYTRLGSTDDKHDPSGAYHKYVILPAKPKKKRGRKKADEDTEEAPQEEAPQEDAPISTLSLQEGPRKEVDVNGFTDEDLARILIDRMECFQEGEFPSHYNENAAAHFKSGYDWLMSRKKDRENRGVEGTNQA